MMRSPTLVKQRVVASVPGSPMAREPLASSTERSLMPSRLDFVSGGFEQVLDAAEEFSGLAFGRGNDQDGGVRSVEECVGGDGGGDHGFAPLAMAVEDDLARFGG